MPNEITADFVVVGSGAGGGPLAARLALAGFEVLVLEAGDDQGANLTYQLPIFHGRASEDPAMSWRFFVQHYADRARQSSAYDSKYNEQNGGIFYPRAGTLGGCTAHNAMITVYPHDHDWDALAALTGDDSWRAERMRDYFERLERCGYIPEPLLPDYNPSRHGFAGWLGTEQADPRLAKTDPLLVKLLASAVAVVAAKLVRDVGNPLDVLQALLAADPVDVTAALLRHPGDPLEAVQGVLARHTDPNDWRISRGRREGVFQVPLATWHGRRNGPREFLRTVEQQHRDRLTIVSNALATRVLLDDDRVARGVQFLKGRHLYGADPNFAKAAPAEAWVAHARKEVILAGGTFNTPQLLMLSGIGPKGELEEKRLPCLVPLEGVGKNLQDRYEVGVVSELTQDLRILGNCAFRPPAEGDPPDPCYEQWQKTGTGLYATNGAVLALVRRSRPDLPDPDLFVFGLPGLFKGYFVHYSEQILAQHNVFTWAILKGHTTNTAGEVCLRSADPRDVPAVNFRYFDEGSDGWRDDLQAVVEGVKLVREVMGVPTMAGLVGNSRLLPAGDIGSMSDQDIAEAIKHSAWGHHACGTCKMGKADDPLAVVDGNFRVHGTRNLRVVDASVFPRIPGFFIVTSVYMVSEKAADAIAATWGH